jgi:hypothetical protein
MLLIRHECPDWDFLEEHPKAYEVPYPEGQLK